MVAEDRQSRTSAAWTYCGWTCQSINNDVVITRID